jgi:catechol 2,3-dioxygenase-like lactoylglutathione lyase family enzyme
MKHSATSIRTFIGAMDYNISRAFYKELGFEEHVISDDMSYFKVVDNIGFYLQDYYAKDWVNNSMIFLEVDDVQRYLDELQKLDLPARYKNLRLTHIHNNDWGREFFMHDPSGVLWHFGQFS